jgi:bifunctional DNA-binding transcriptional regulator/antitoxin component of YhaV-PrlF toxin-antitoxin module
MATLHGPHAVSAQFQLKLPARLAKELNISAGDEFYWRRSDDDPAVVVLIPVEVVERRYSAGERAEATKREVASELDTETADLANYEHGEH